MKKVFKIFFITILIILLLAGAGFSLLYFKILKTPNFVSYIPVISNLLIEDEVKVPPEEVALDKAKKENANLKNTITDKQEEIKEIKKYNIQDCKVTLDFINYIKEFMEKEGYKKYLKLFETK